MENMFVYYYYSFSLVFRRTEFYLFLIFSAFARSFALTLRREKEKNASWNLVE
jgi:hypothetical protein